MQLSNESIAIYHEEEVSQSERPQLRLVLQARERGYSAWRKFWALALKLVYWPQRHAHWTFDPTEVRSKEEMDLRARRHWSGHIF